jgi:hypothetical protein
MRAEEKLSVAIWLILLGAAVHLIVTSHFWKPCVRAVKFSEWEPCEVYTISIRKSVVIRRHILRSAPFMFGPGWIIRDFF